MPSSSAADQAFKRHSRPQQPILPGTSQTGPRPLNVQSTPSWTSSATSLIQSRAQSVGATETSLPTHSSWVDFFQLGHLTQGDQVLIVCTSRRQKSKLFMFKKAVNHSSAPDQACLSFRHPNILPVQHIVSSDTNTHLGCEYVRITLGEVQSAHLPLQECHIRCIAKAMVEALRHLYQQGFTHGQVNANNIRLCGRTGRVFLSNCDECTRIQSDYTNQDLEDLGLVLLDCMEADDKRQKRTASDVKLQRSTNKVFGLSDPEKWSGSKRLIDFLDDIFGSQRRPADKLTKAHDYISRNIEDRDVLYPLTELAALECVSMWQVVE